MNVLVVVGCEEKGDDGCVWSIEEKEKNIFKQTKGTLQTKWQSLMLLLLVV